MPRNRPQLETGHFLSVGHVGRSVDQPDAWNRLDAPGILVGKDGLHHLAHLHFDLLVKVVSPGVVAFPASPGQPNLTDSNRGLVGKKGNPTVAQSTPLFGTLSENY